MTKVRESDVKGTRMPRRRPVDADLPPLPGRERRDVQVKIRLTRTEVDALIAIRPDLSAAGVVAQLVDDVLAGRHRPPWAARTDQGPW